MKEINYFRINQDGSVQSVHTTVTDISIGDKFKDELTSGTLRKCYGMFLGIDIHELLDKKIVNCAIVNSAGDSTWTVELPFLPMTTHFKVAEDSTMTPSFSKVENPLATVMWETPKDMRLLWLINITRSGDAFMVGNQFLLAQSPSGSLHKLPISNLYDDCRICTGNFNSVADSNLQCLRQSFLQLLKSQWQGDLYEHQPDSYKERTDRMFRFKPSEKEGFEQQPPEFQLGKSWQNYCDVVSTQWITSNLTIK